MLREKRMATQLESLRACLIEAAVLSVKQPKELVPKLREAEAMVKDLQCEVGQSSENSSPESDSTRSLSIESAFSSENALLTKDS
jgi:hypothetical protein